MASKLIDHVRFTRQPEYGFHHPLIRTVAYESQLKSDRAELHRRVAAAIESRDPAAAEENTRRCSLSRSESANARSANLLAEYDAIPSEASRPEPELMNTT